MKIKYLGHAAFVITSDTGAKIITDPYEPNPTLTYGEITESADVVTVSHGHPDHSNVAAVRGKPEVVRRVGSSTARGVEFRVIAVVTMMLGEDRRVITSCFALSWTG